MWNVVLSAFFGCSHRRTTFPQTARRKPASNAGLETYVVCLECGTEFEYDWQEMRMRKALRRLSPAPVLQSPAPKLTEASGSTCQV